MIQLGTFSTSRKNTLAARSFRQVSSHQLFYILFKNVADHGVWLLKHLKIAQTAQSPSFLHEIDISDRKALLMSTSEANSNSKFKFPNDKIVRKASQQIDLSAVQYEAAESRDFQIFWHTALSESFSQNVHNLQEEFRLLDKYSQYCTEFINLIPEFQKIWESQFGGITVVKHRINLLKDNVLPVPSVLFRANPKTREPENVETNKKITKWPRNQHRPNGLHS